MKLPTLVSLFLFASVTGGAELSRRQASIRPAHRWPSNKRLIVYYANWDIYERKYTVADIPIDYISDVNYAFYDLAPSGNSFVLKPTDPWADTQLRYTKSGVPPFDPPTGSGTFGNFGQFIKLKKAGKKFNFGVSVGGWASSKYFSKAMASSTSRKNLVNSLINLVNTYPTLIDRIDLDWEYVSNDGKNYGLAGNFASKSDSKNFGSFLKELRETLDAKKLGRIEISACTSSSPALIKQLPIAAMVAYLDTINIMTYDFMTSAWGPSVTGHHTNLYSTSYAPASVKLAVDTFIRLGVPASKLVIGAAYYSRGFANTQGLGKPSNGLVSDKSYEAGSVEYKDLPRPGATEQWDDQAKAGYSYDPDKKILNSYDTVESVMAKCEFIWKMGLKGVIVWEISGDVKITDKRSLTLAMYNRLSKTNSSK